MRERHIGLSGLRQFGEEAHLLCDARKLLIRSLSVARTRSRFTVE
jgi:hypothetical protein